MQYTIRDIPPHLDEALRTKAEREGKSLNQTVVDTLATAIGVPRGSGERATHWLDGWLKDAQPLEPEVIEAIEAQGRLTPEEQAGWDREIARARRAVKSKSKGKSSARKERGSGRRRAG